jgi:hypothetical protein
MTCSGLGQQRASGVRKALGPRRLLGLTIGSRGTPGGPCFRVGQGCGTARRPLTWVRWAGKARSRSEHGRSELVVSVKEVLWVTAVHPASCGVGYGRARYKSRPK